MCKENETIATAAESTPGHVHPGTAAPETREASDLNSTGNGDKHPHEPPVLITDGSFIIECDEDIIADGLGGPYGGGNRKRHKRRTPTGTPERSIRCVRVDGGSLQLPTGFNVNDPAYQLLIALASTGIRVKYPSGGCQIKIYWDEHPCGPEH